MKNYFVLLISSIVIFSGCSYLKPVPLQQFDYNKGRDTENSNFNNMNEMFKDIQSEEADDYYFVVIGDTRNMVRSDDLNGFNFVAKQIIYAKDNDEYVYDKIKFIMHMGDLVYDGVADHQWDNLKRAYSNKDYYENNYPYIKLLVRQKPVFPVLGNHEIMQFKFKKETKYMNLASRNKGLQNFNEFNNWEDFIADSNIITSIPSELSAEKFTKLCNVIEADESELMGKHYLLQKDKQYHLRIYVDLLQDLVSSDSDNPGAALDEDAKTKVINDLYPIFTKQNYNVLPAISSDNFICYAFEVGEQIFFVMDSMSRGWHYNTFSKLKKAMYSKKKDRHNLHLYSKSNLNGQYEFYKALQEYADDSQKTIVPFMHHTPINSVNDIDGKGIQYNLKLMLGVEYDEKNKDSVVFDKKISDNTFFDEMLFSDACNEQRHSFSSCVHFYQKLGIETVSNDSVLSKVDWHITGGGGGELETKHDDATMDKTVDLYNKRLLDTYSARNRNGDRALINPEIKIAENKVEHSYNYLLVHVENGKISEVIPKLIKKEDVKLKKPLIKLSATLSSPVYYKPMSAGQLVTLSFWSFGLEKFSPSLSPFTWEPSLGIGYLNYNLADLENNEMAAIDVLSFLRFKARFSNAREFIFNFFDSSTIRGRGNKLRNFISVGIEGPLLYNFFYNTRGSVPKLLKKFNFAYNYHIANTYSEGDDSEFAKELQMSWVIKFSLF